MPHEVVVDTLITVMVPFWDEGTIIAALAVELRAFWTRLIPSLCIPIPVKWSIIVSWIRI